jgi:hypothetical protein
MNNLFKRGFWTVVGILSMDWEDFLTFSESLSTPDRIHKIGANRWIELTIQRGKRESRCFRETVIDEIHNIQAQFRFSKRRNPRN